MHAVTNIFGHGGNGQDVNGGTRPITAMGAHATDFHWTADCIHEFAEAVHRFGRTCQVGLTRIVGDVSFVFDKFVGTCSSLMCEFDDKFVTMNEQPQTMQQLVKLGVTIADALLVPDEM
jgi:hypothetical protein